LVVEQIKRYIDIFLDSSFTTLPAFSYNDIMKNSDHDQTNLMVVGSNVDAQQELVKMRKVWKKDSPFHYRSLNYSNMHDLDQLLSYAA